MASSKGAKSVSGCGVIGGVITDRGRTSQLKMSRVRLRSASVRAWKMMITCLSFLSYWILARSSWIYARCQGGTAGLTGVVADEIDESLH